MAFIDGILPKGPYPSCLRMADRALLAGYTRYIFSSVYLFTDVFQRAPFGSSMGDVQTSRTSTPVQTTATIFDKVVQRLYVRTVQYIPYNMLTGLLGTILGMDSANERRRYYKTHTLIGRAQTHNISPIQVCFIPQEKPPPTL